MVWLKQLKDVVGEADDVLDEVHYEILRREVKKRDRMATKVPSLPSLKKFSFRREMGHKIENIGKKLFEINKQANDLGLQIEQPTSPTRGSFCRETDPYSEEFTIVGRATDELNIIRLLTQPRKDEKLIIVPIVGMGGIGKTTLAKSVYNNPKIGRYFDIRAWLCVSVKVDVNTLLAKIYESLVGEECKSQTRVNLITSIRKELESERYLLVLDDVWDEERPHWDDFRSCMLKVNSRNGSGIIVSTRNLEIGTKAMTHDFCALECLSDDECWSIFKERVFVTGQSPLPDLEMIGRDIVKKCRGLPLLINVIGGMLRNHNNKDKWLSIKDSKVWDLEEEGDRVKNSLKLSFDNLPNSVVKQCFAYCSIFQKDTIMKREELIQLWMALGLVQADQTRSKEMEDVGNDIFQILVSHSLFQVVKRDEYGYVIGCSMHDLVHDLSLSLSKHEGLCLVGPTINDITSNPHVKHLAMYTCRENKVRINISFKEMVIMAFKEETLHTLFFEGEVEKSISFHHFKCMRILKFNGCKLEKINDSIGELVHLRHLDLSYTDIDVLPKSIGKLYHLQTLKLLGCYHLKELPEDMRNLISLQYFEFQESIPSHIVGKLTSLRTMPYFRVGREDGCQIQELGHLKHLRGELCISGLEKIISKEDAAKANLLSKKNLFGIEFRWSSGEGTNRNDKDVLEGLQPPLNMKSLKIENFSGDNFLAWVTKMAIDIEGTWTVLHKLVQITLSGCTSCLSLPILEYLPLLRHLLLMDMDNLTCLSNSLGENIIGSVKPLSPSLRSLEVRSMKRLEKWIDGATNSSTVLSPVLERLHIDDCPKIIFLDECHPHPLVSLVIWDCKNLVSIKSIEGLISLQSLEIDSCPCLLEIPSLHNQGHSLKSLSVTRCHKLNSLPREIFDCFGFLNELALGPFSEELHSFPSLQGIEKLRNHLHSLELKGWHHWESIPEEIKHLTSLCELSIVGFAMRELPMWLKNMSSIRIMYLVDCLGLNHDIVARGAPREAYNVSFNSQKVKLV